MYCPSCGVQVTPGDAFCRSCGADVRGLSSPQQPTQHMAAAPPPPPPGVAAVPPSPSPQGANAAAAPAAKKGLSSGAVVAVVAGILVLVLALGVAGFFAVQGFMAFRKSATVGSATTGQTEPLPESSIVATEAPDEKAADPGQGSAGAKSGDAGIVTDAEARSIVDQFLVMRIKGDIEGSKALCTKNMLTGENGQMVNDQYWHPDSFEITKTTPDLMYIHVTTMGEWPSGREPTIYSVFRDPETGTVLIDGMLDPESSPDLVTP